MGLYPFSMGFYPFSMGFYPFSMGLYPFSMEFYPFVCLNVLEAKWMRPGGRDPPRSAVKMV